VELLNYHYDKKQNTREAAMPKDVVIITGANSGIGHWIARALYESGTSVTGIDLTDENMGEMSSILCDVTNQAHISSAIKQIVEEWGRIDVLVNNACLALLTPFDEKSPEEFNRELDVNLFGYVNMIRAVFPQMKKQGSGVIHNVSSAVGITGFEGLSGYVSAKGAIESLTRTLAIEFEKFGIIVNLMHPPLTRTASSQSLGIPEQLMADAEVVGRKLAKKIGSHKKTVTPGFMELTGVISSRLFPGSLGRYLSRKASEARRSSSIM
jgi:NAD(P)-dependent dehydrogenase (short-subunit alcohol dehydrogenase family)